MLSAGAVVDWTMKTSRPRALRSMRTKISPSAKFRRVTPSGDLPMRSPISCESGRLARPLSRRRGPRLKVSSMAPERNSPEGWAD